MIKSPFLYSWSDVCKVIGLTLLYAESIHVVIGYLTADGLISIIWIPSGIGFAMLLRLGQKLWPAIFIGAATAYLLSGYSVGLAAAVVCSNTCEPLLGCYLLKRDSRFDPELKSLRDFKVFVLVAAVSAAVAALIGVTALEVSASPPESFWRALRLWWMGNFLGIVVITPFLLVWRQFPRHWFTPAQLLHTLLFCTLAFLCGQILFFEWMHGLFGVVARDYWVFLFAIWGATCFGRHGALWVVVLFALQGLLGALMGLGYFNEDIALTKLTNYWCFVIILHLASLSLALVLEERQQSLQQANEAKQNAMAQVLVAEQMRQELLANLAEQKNTEAALKYERDLNKRYLDTVEAIVLVLDTQGLIRLINSKGCELLGYAEFELVGKNWFDLCLLPTEGKDKVMVMFQKLIGGKQLEVSFFENEVLTKQGQMRLILWHNSLLIDVAGHITGVLSSGNDVTDARSVELKLNEQMAELRRWYGVMLNREQRILELKQEVNALQLQLNQSVRYSSAPLIEDKAC